MRLSLLIFELLLWTVFQLTYNDAIVFKMTNAVCKSYNESWITVQTCRLKAVSRNVTKLNIVANLLHPVYDLGVQAQIYKKANGYKPWLMKFDVDICRFLKRAYNPAAIFVFKLFKEFTNFNHSCPYKGIQIIDGLYLRSDVLPHTIPTGDYMLSMTWVFDKRPQYISDVYFVFEENLI